MGLSKLGQYIKQVDLRNSDDIYGEDAVVGISTQKEMIQTKANLNGVKLTSYKLVPPKHFAYVSDTSRRGDKMSLCYNNTDNTYIVSAISTIFKIIDESSLSAEYLYMYFNRPEFDRYARFDSWGSARETFSWESMCEIEIDLPPLSVQQKYVDIYNAMVANQKNYERGLDDLKLTCDAYIDKLKHSKKLVPIGNFIEQIDNRNTTNEPYLFKGLSMDNYFIDSIADSNGLDFKNYKIIAPGEYGAVLMKVGRDARLTIARNDSSENYLISPAHHSFKTFGIDTDYFMANVNRAEFERRGWFSCDTSARGSLSWGEFMNLVIPDANEKEQNHIANLHKLQITRREINEKLKAQIKNICPILIKGSIEEARKEA